MKQSISRKIVEAVKKSAKSSCREVSPLGIFQPARPEAVSKMVQESK